MKRKNIRVDVVLSEHESNLCEQEMKRRRLKHPTDLVRELLTESQTSGTGSTREEKQTEKLLSAVETKIDEVQSYILARLSKLERIQRTIVLNTAYARGYVIGSVRTSAPESRKHIEQEMRKAYDTQLEFFLNLFPDQREGDSK